MCYVRVGTVHQQAWSMIAATDERQVRVGHDSLVGEVIRIDADKATIQVYEETGMVLLSSCAQLLTT